MQVFLIILAIIFLLLAVCFLIPIRLEAVYEKAEKTEAKVMLKYGFLTFNLYPNDKNKKETEKEDKPQKNEDFSFEKKKEQLEKYIRIFNAIKDDVAEALSYMAKRAIVFDRIEIKSEFGFGDAMNTGIFTGLYNGFVYSVLGVIHHNSKLREMEVRLTPNFEKKCFNNRFCCILHIKMAHIIVIAFNVLNIYRKIKKEGSK